MQISQPQAFQAGWYCDSFSKDNEENPVWDIINKDIFTRDILGTGLLDPARTRSRPPPDPTGRPPPPAYKTQKNRIDWVSRLGSLHSPRQSPSWPPHHHLWLNIYLSFGDFKTVNLEPWIEFCELNHNLLRQNVFRNIIIQRPRSERYDKLYSWIFLTIFETDFVYFWRHVDECYGVICIFLACVWAESGVLEAFIYSISKDSLGSVAPVKG